MFVSSKFNSCSERFLVMKMRAAVPRADMADKKKNTIGESFTIASRRAFSHRLLAQEFFIEAQFHRSFN